MCMGRTHMVSGVAAYLGYATLTGLHTGPALAGAVVTAYGALLPDLDHPNSMIAWRLHIRPLCRVVARISGGHRHGTHSALFVALTWLAASYVHLPLVAARWLYHPGYANARLPGWAVLALALGVAAHIVGDCLTPEGCPILWPLSHRFSLHLFTTDTWREAIFAVACLVASVWFLHLIVPNGIWSPA